MSFMFSSPDSTSSLSQNKYLSQDTTTRGSSKRFSDSLFSGAQSTYPSRQEKHRQGTSSSTLSQEQQQLQLQQQQQQQQRYQQQNAGPFDIPVDSLLDDTTSLSTTLSTFSRREDSRNSTAYLKTPLLGGRTIHVEQKMGESMYFGTPRGIMDQTPLRTPSSTKRLSVVSASSRPNYRVTPGTLLKSPGQVDPFFEADESNGIGRQTNTNWVTVFGFPPSKASYILKKFAHYGEILDHKVGKGNWMHIFYKERFQAQKALSKNAKIFDSVYMIGVVECIDQSVIGKSSVFENETSGSVFATSSDMVHQDNLLEGRKRLREDDNKRSPLEPSEKRSRPQPDRTIFGYIFDKLFGF